MQTSSESVGNDLFETSEDCINCSTVKVWTGQ